MFIENLEIRAAKNQSEVKEAMQLMASVAPLDSFVANNWLNYMSSRYPNFNNEHVRIAIYKGKIVSTLQITTDVIRIGEARLKMGGLGWVSTDVQYRNKGIASALIQNAVQYMTANSYQVSMLFGIPNFYHRFGFISTLPEYYANITTRELLTIKPIPHKIRKVKPGDILLLRKIHDEEDVDVSCSIIRTQAHFTVKWKEWSRAKVITDLNGKILGYFLPKITDKNTLLIEEIGSINIEVSDTILFEIGKLAEKEKVGMVQIAAPPCHLSIRTLIKRRSIHETHYKRDEGGMMAIINEEETLECMTPEWEKLIQQKSLIDKEDEVTLIISGTPFCFHFRKGSIAIFKKLGKNKISIDRTDFVRLLTGYQYTEDVLNKKWFVLSSTAREFLNTIFTKRCPYVWQMDRF